MRNDAKFRAAKQGASYEEFQQIVKVKLRKNKFYFIWIYIFQKKNQLIKIEYFEHNMGYG